MLIMAAEAKNIDQNQARLAEIVEQAQNSELPTDDVLSLLEEAVNIGMDVCKTIARGESNEQGQENSR